MMRLTDLEPQFLKRVDDTHFKLVNSLAKADGIQFVCPKCFEANGRKRPGVHGILCWAPTVPQTTSPNPGRWEMLGTGFHDLTLRAGSSSVHLPNPDGCGAHFFITNGEIVST